LLVVVLRGQTHTLDEQLVGERITELRTTLTQLRARRDDLTHTLTTAPITPEAATLTQVADHITDVINSGTDQTRKALIEALIAEIKIIAPNRVIPVFRIPQPDAPDNEVAPTSGKPPARATTTGVRAMTNLVDLLGNEPWFLVEGLPFGALGWVDVDPRTAGTG
jgi:site-specific DNA recombinase